jgi:hypothetical protein
MRPFFPHLKVSSASLAGEDVVKYFDNSEILDGVEGLEGVDGGLVVSFTFDLRGVDGAEGVGVMEVLISDFDFCWFFILMGDGLGVGSPFTSWLLLATTSFVDMTECCWLLNSERLNYFECDWSLTDSMIDDQQLRD